MIAAAVTKETEMVTKPSNDESENGSDAEYSTGETVTASNVKDACKDVLKCTRESVGGFLDWGQRLTAG